MTISLSHNKSAQSGTLQPLTVVDLDGTLIAGNSFTRFTIWLIRRALRRGDLATAAAVAATVLRRKARLCSHAAAKARIMCIADSRLHPEDYSAFAATLLPLVRAGVRTRLEEAQAHGHAVCLATAAPWQYAAPLGAMLGMDEVVATYPPQGVGPMIECRGEVKQRRIQALCSRLRLRPALTFTDHHDDLPLLIWTAASGGRNILVSPGASTRMIAGGAGVPFDLL